MARDPAPPPGHARLDARHRACGRRSPGRRTPRPAGPRLHRGVAPPRGRPAGPARGPDGVGARPPEVRRRRPARPLPQAVRHAQGRHPRRAQPHRHHPRRGTAGDAGRPPPVARRRRSRRRTSRRHQRPHRCRDPGAPRRDRPAGGREEVQPGTTRGRREGGSGPPRAGIRHRQGPGPVPGTRGRTRRRARRRRRCAHPRLCRGELHPVARQPGNRVAARRVVLPAPARSPQAAAPRPGQRRQAADGALPDLGPGADPGAAGPGGHGGAGPRGRRLGRPRATLGARRSFGLGVPPGRPRGPTRQRARRHRSRGRTDPGLGGCGAGAAVAPDHQRSGRRCLVGGPGRDDLPAGGARARRPHARGLPGPDSDADRRGPGRRPARVDLPGAGDLDRASSRSGCRPAVAGGHAPGVRGARRRPGRAGAGGLLRRAGGSRPGDASSRWPGNAPQGLSDDPAIHTRIATCSAMSAPILRLDRVHPSDQGEDR